MTQQHRISFLVLLLALIALSVMMSQRAQAHCQIPCGIYDDHARVKTMLEDAATIDKSIKLIADLSGKTDAQSQNQVIRWVMNKETHAQNIIEISADYFLTQRVKPAQKDYDERLKKHHAIILAAMKAKQNTDVKYAKALTDSIKAIEAYYPPHKH